MLFEHFKNFLFNPDGRSAIKTEANSILKSEAFMVAYESLQERILGDLMETKLEETAKREKLYMQYQAVTEIAIEMQRLATGQLDQPVNTGV